MTHQNAINPHRTIRVALVALPEVSAAVLYGLHEVLRYTGRIWENLTGQPESAVTTFEPQVVAHRPDPFRTTLGITVAPDIDFGSAPEPEVLIVPDLDLRGGVPEHPGWRAARDWIGARYAAGAQACSVCTGALLLAEAGLLDGRDATSHWGAAPLIRQRHPEVRLCIERVLVPAGDDHRVVTCGGSSTWTELALYLIARLAGEAEARRMAKVFHLGDHGDGQLPYTAMVRPRQHDDEVIGRAQQWIATHYASSNPVRAMTERSGLEDRTFKRRFRQCTGYRPLEYVQTLRVEEAKHLLETTDQPIEDVARDVGYEDASAFRRLFKRRVGITPGHYRRKFRFPSPGPKGDLTREM